MSERDSNNDPAISGSKEIGALAHLYRAEVYRSTVWRQRLDMTTNWAVVTTGIALSVSFATATASPLPILLVGLLSAMFLLLEARRYRYFTVWRFRARLLELAVYVPLLRGEGASIAQDRGTVLSDDYVRPQYRISAIRSVGRRLRRNYAWIFVIQGVAYFGKLAIHPTDAVSLEQLIERAHIGPIPGWMSFLMGLCFHATWITIAWTTLYLEKRDKTITEDYLDSDDAHDAPVDTDPMP